MNSPCIAWRVVAAIICGTISGTLLAIAIGQTVFFDTPLLALGAGLGGLMTAGAGLLVVYSTRSPDRPN